MSETRTLPQGHNREYAEAPTPGNMYISPCGVSLFWGVRRLGLCCEVTGASVTNPNVVRGGSASRRRGSCSPGWSPVSGSLPPRFTTLMV